MKAQTILVKKYDYHSYRCTWTEKVGGKSPNRHFFHGLNLTCPKCMKANEKNRLINPNVYPKVDFTNGGWTSLSCPNCGLQLGRAYLRKIPWIGIWRKVKKEKRKPRCRGGLKGARCVLPQGHKGNHHIKWEAKSDG